MLLSILIDIFFYQSSSRFLKLILTKHSLFIDGNQNCFWLISTVIIKLTLI